jgi:hypothetical protein
MRCGSTAGPGGGYRSRWSAGHGRAQTGQHMGRRAAGGGRALAFIATALRACTLDHPVADDALPRSASRRRLFRGVSVVADGSDGAFVVADLVTPGSPGAGVPELLHWTGKAWKPVKLPIPVQELGPMAHDGHGGLWVASVPASLNCSDECFNIDMLHRGAAGTWSMTIVQVDNLGLTAMRLIPGSTSLWASGSVSGGNDFAPVMIKYGP